MDLITYYECVCPAADISSMLEDVCTQVTSTEGDITTTCTCEDATDITSDGSGNYLVHNLDSDSNQQTCFQFSQSSPDCQCYSYSNRRLDYKEKCVSAYDYNCYRCSCVEETETV